MDDFDAGQVLQQIITSLQSTVPMFLISGKEINLNHIILIVFIPLFVFFSRFLFVKGFEWFTNFWYGKDVVPTGYKYAKISNEKNGRAPEWISSVNTFINHFHKNSGEGIYIYDYPTHIDEAIFMTDVDYLYDNGTVIKIDMKKIMEEIKKTTFKLRPEWKISEFERQIFYYSTVKETENLPDYDRPGQQKKVNQDYAFIYGRSIEMITHFFDLVVDYSKFIKKYLTDYKPKKKVYYANENEDNSSYDFSTYDINVKKTFESVFLSNENQKVIINNIDIWKKNKNFYLEKGIPYKLGFMFYGLPGCGKSSTILAIANELKYKIQSINMKNIGDMDLHDIAEGINESVVTFEDFDSFAFTDKRKDEEDDDEVKPKEIKETKSGFEFSSLKKTKKVSLDTFLEILDGYTTFRDCIVIITTNHPERIDAAIKRPGRIDYQVEFKLCDEKQFHSMFKFYFGKEITEINPEFTFVEGKYSTSHLINTIIMPNIFHPEKVLIELHKGQTTDPTSGKGQTTDPTSGKNQ